MSNIILHVEPNKTVSWDFFIKEYLGNSIALDGFVYGRPQFEPKGPYVNFNHHEEVDRLATRATCEQVLLAIRQGLFKTFTGDINVFVNDCDQDVCVALFLLSNHHLVVNTMNPIINRLVTMEGFLDCTAGAYPYPVDLPILEELAWVFEPYTQFRVSGQLSTGKSTAFRSIITDVNSRIMSHITGNGHKIPLDTRYERIYTEKDYVIVKEIGASARTGMFSDGITAYVSVRESQTPNRYIYSIGRLSPFINFNLPSNYIKLNQAEGIPEDSVDKWGGSDITGGSPRIAGSKLSPDEIRKVLNS